MAPLRFHILFQRYHVSVVGGHAICEAPGRQPVLAVRVQTQVDIEAWSQPPQEVRHGERFRFREGMAAAIVLAAWIVAGARTYSIGQ